MRIVSARYARYELGELIDKTRDAPVTVTKYGRRVVVVVVEE